MDDVLALQNTVRRCTAILVSAVGLVAYVRAVNAPVVGLLLAVGGALYVGLSVDATSERASDTTE